MSEIEHNEFEVPGDPSPRKTMRAPRQSAIFACLIPVPFCIWTLVVIRMAAKDRSWGALHTAMIDGPLVNALLAIIGLALVVVPNMTPGETSKGLHVVVVL